MKADPIDINELTRGGRPPLCLIGLEVIEQCRNSQSPRGRPEDHAEFSPRMNPLQQIGPSIRQRSWSTVTEDVIHVIEVRC
jgi:hypothetical protein